MGETEWVVVWLEAVFVPKGLAIVATGAARGEVQIEPAPKGRTMYHRGMPGTFSQVLLHVVFSTKHRAPQITPDVRPRLYAFIGGIVRDEGATLYAIGGIDDHVHHLIRLKTDKSIAELMRNVKARSSAWMHETFPGKPFAWQEGYSVFSVSKSIERRVKEYIENQVEHHKKRDFREELLALLRAHEIEFEERYVFD